MRVFYVHDIFERFNIAIGNESEASRFTSSLVLHYGAILNLAILNKILLELFITQVVREAPYEYLPELRIQLRRYLLLWLMPLFLYQGGGTLIGQILSEALKTNISCISLLIRHLRLASSYLSLCGG